MFLAPSSSRASQSLAYNPTAKGIPEQAWRLNTDSDRHLDLVNLVTLCTLGFVDVPICQSPQLVARPPSPSVQAQHPSFTAPGPSARTRMTFTFTADHCLRLPRLRTTSQETRCMTRLTPRLVLKLNPKCKSVDNHSSLSSNDKGTYQPCVRKICTCVERGVGT